MNHDLGSADFLTFEPESWESRFDEIVKTASQFFADNPEKNLIVFDVMHHGEVIGRETYSRHFIEHIGKATASEFVV